MAAYWVWWILAGGLVGAELVTGTFYLLAVGLAFGIGGLAAWLGASLGVQLATAGLLAFGGTVLAHRWRLRRGTPPPHPPFDVGQSVEVQAWNPDGTARVLYRGSLWTAELAAPDAPKSSTMVIVALRGSRLVIASPRP